MFKIGKNEIMELFEQQVFLLKRFYARQVLDMDLEFFFLDNSGRKYKYFNHSYNLGHYCRRYTERTVELALADEWLKIYPDSWEIGAVTPYYWPNRVGNIVDPTDKHPQVNCRFSLLDIDLTDKNLLSISTIEHIGQLQYGLAEDANAIQALQKIASESNNFLITFPVGWNAVLDDFIFTGGARGFCNVHFLSRNRYELWDSVPAESARLPYGGKRMWANSVVILHRGLN